MHTEVPTTHPRCRPRLLVLLDTLGDLLYMGLDSACDIWSWGGVLYKSAAPNRHTFYPLLHAGLQMRNSRFTLILVLQPKRLVLSCLQIQKGKEHR